MKNKKIWLGSILGLSSCIALMTTGLTSCGTKNNQEQKDKILKAKLNEIKFVTANQKTIKERGVGISLPIKIIELEDRLVPEKIIKEKIF